jgi:hypothetical protein
VQRVCTPEPLIHHDSVATPASSTISRPGMNQSVPRAKAIASAIGIWHHSTASIALLAVSRRESTVVVLAVLSSVAIVISMA